MNKQTKIVEKCFQCGKPSVVTGEQKELINNSLIISTQRICSDPECQSRTEMVLKREKDKRDMAMLQKLQLADNRA